MLETKLESKSKELPEYITTITRLREVAIDNLGAMNKGSFDDFEKRAKEIAKQKGIQNPAIIIDLEFRDDINGIHKELPHKIIKHLSNPEEEWIKFIEESKTLYKHIPNVYIVDSDLYTAWI